MPAPAAQEVDPAGQGDLAVVVEVAGGDGHLSPGPGREQFRNILVIRLTSTHHQTGLSVLRGGGETSVMKYFHSDQLFSPPTCSCLAAGTAPSPGLT